MPSKLPDHIQRLFWDCDAAAVTMEEYPDYVAGKVLSVGTGQDIAWLRGRIGDEGVRDYILRTKGRQLSPEQLRYWQLILDLRPATVTRWIRSPRRRVWDNR